MIVFLMGLVAGFSAACALFYWMIQLTAEKYAKDGYIAYRGKTYIFRETFEVGPNG